MRCALSIGIEVGRLLPLIVSDSLIACFWRKVFTGRVKYIVVVVAALVLGTRLAHNG